MTEFSSSFPLRKKGKNPSKVEDLRDGVKKSKWKFKMAFATGVNKKPKKFKAVWYGFQGILKLSGRVNQASLKLSAGFSNTVC